MTTPRGHYSVLFCVLALLAVTGCASLDPALIEDILGSAAASGSQAPLDEATVGKGLKEALRVGTRRAVERVSQPDGYLANEVIRIRLPNELEDMATALRTLGFSRQVENLEVAMNRAAERAAKEAVDVFVGAITSMTLGDVWGIFRGHDTAATEYFKQRTTATLSRRFQPIIEDKMNQVGLYREYERLAGVYNTLPFVRRPAVDLDSYLTDKALDGLFKELAKEERKIREDPIARTTELLRKVFGSR